MITFEIDLVVGVASTGWYASLRIGCLLCLDSQRTLRRRARSPKAVSRHDSILTYARADVGIFVGDTRLLPHAWPSVTLGWFGSSIVDQCMHFCKRNAYVAQQSSVDKR